MSIDVNELIEYYSNVQPFLKDTYRESLAPIKKMSGRHTNSSGSGLLIPLRGKACYTLNGTSYQLEPGRILHAGAFMDLDKKIIGNQTWSYIVVHYKLAHEDISSFPCYNSHFLIKTGMNITIENCAEQLHTREKENSSLSPLRVRALFASLLEEVVTSAQRFSQYEDERVAEDAVHFLNDNYMKHITIGQLAQFYDMDIKRFSYIFNKNVGVPALVYLTNLRLEQAKKLLGSSQYTVAQVAESVGYQDNYYFSRLFKKQTGVSPTGFTMLNAKKSIPI